MRPITRETIIDRRQPAIDADNAGTLRTIGIGTTVWTLASPVIAMFIGSMVAGRLANTYERGVGASHGFVVWALTSVLGICATVGMVTMVARTGAMAFAPQNAVIETRTIGHAELNQAAQAVETTGKVLLGVGPSLLISLVAALLGGAGGVGRRPRTNGTRTVRTPVVPPPAPPIVPPGTYVEP